MSNFPTLKSTEDLGKFVSWIQDQKSKIATDKKENKNSSKDWILFIILSVIVFIVLAVVSFKSWMQGKQLAELKHEKDVLEEEKIQAVAKQKIEKEDEKNLKLQEQQVILTDKINKLELDLKNVENKRSLAKKQIERLTDWEDLDKLLKGKK